MRVLYRPKGRAEEYSAGYALNLYSGCPSRCAYCYVPQVLRCDRETFHAKCEPRKDILKHLERDLAKFGKLDEPIFLCFTCDPFPYERTQVTTRDAIRLIHASGNHVRVLTKSPGNAVLALGTGDELWTTLVFDNAPDCAYWEPGAPYSESRMDAIEWVSRNIDGVKLGVSFEPAIEPEQTLRMARRMAKCCGTMKFGKLNHVGHIPERHRRMVRPVNWRQFALDVIETMDEIGYTNYVLKRDLLECLEPGDYPAKTIEDLLAIEDERISDVLEGMAEAEQ